ncbi:MAG: hypothetical protein HY835_11145 [Anaerolineae bacterium]|nr:hypothetical protein [Anaerolineae bacterium]
MKRMYGWRKRSGRRTWLHCRNCGRRLVQIAEIDLRTCVPLITAYAVEMRMVCARCGTVREFRSIRRSIVF